MTKLQLETSLRELQDLYVKEKQEKNKWKIIATENKLLADEYKRKYEEIVEECYHRGIERDLNS